jgi:hypothetical protein
MKLLLAVCLAACGNKAADAPKSDKPSHADVDPACSAKVKALEPWLAALELEKKSYEIGTLLPVLDRSPMPVPRESDAIEVRKGAIYAWDISEHDHASSKLEDNPTQAQLVAFLTKTRAKLAVGDEYDPAPDDVVRIDVMSDANWGDVVRVIDAATKAGYARAVFPFGATSKVAQPPGVEAQTMTEDAAQKVRDKLDVLQKQCQPWRVVAGNHKPNKKDPVADAAAYAKEVSAALTECNCAANPDEVRALTWADIRWHQASPRVGITIALGGNPTQKVSVPAKTLWPEAAAKLVEVAPDSTPIAVQLAAK